MREFRKPSFSVNKSDVSSTTGRFVISTLEQGFGVTIGNALRRVMLSSLPGVAVTSIQVEGATHEYSPLEGVVEDLTQIVLNIKDLVLHDDLDVDQEIPPLKLDVKGSGKEVKAGDIVCPDMVEVVNKDLVLCHLAEGGHIKMTLHAEKGRGFVTAEENKRADMPVGTIPVDSSFSPIVKVKIDIDSDRVDRDSSYEKLTLEVTTNGSMSPQAAIALASKILDEHFKLFEDLDEAVKQATIMTTTEEKAEKSYSTVSLEDLDLSVRSYNCLKRNGLKTVQDLCNMKESELMTVRNLGKKSYKEILDKLASIGLSLQRDDNMKK